MPLRRKVTSGDYYDCVPASRHSSGDIWSGLPSFGMIGTHCIKGIVITPACDLENHKSEMITYLPIISVHEYFSTHAVLPTILRKIRGQIETAGLSGIEIPSGNFYSLPFQSVCELLWTETRSLLSKAGTGEKQRTAASRIQAGLGVLEKIRNPELQAVPPGELELLIGTVDWKNCSREIAQNKFSTDVHFLPPDEQETDWSGIPLPSLVLFRHPHSIPINILDCANDIDQKDWDITVANLCCSFPGAEIFKGRRPLKRSLLKSRFYSDLITRYVGVHVRLGSPNLSEDSIEKYASQIRTGRMC